MSRIPAPFVDRLLGTPLEVDPRWSVGLLPARVGLRLNAWIPQIGGWLAGTRGPAAAVTLGHTIFVHPRITLTRQLLVHELVHVRQWEADGLFPLRYALEWVRRGYWNNRYEQEARAAEIDSDIISLDQ
jgi:hypothetical protein